MAATQISLGCWIVGLNNANPFLVRILLSETIDDLKDAIKKKKEHTLNHIAANQLDIWKLKNPLPTGEIIKTFGTIDARGEIPDADKLNPLEEVSHYFPDAPVRTMVHLVVRLPHTTGTNEDENPLPKRLKLEGDRSQEERRAKPQFHSESLLPRGDQFRPQPAPLFMDFHRRYWGNPIDPAFTTLPTHGNEEDLSSDVLPGDPFLDVLHVRFLVRAEYIRTFDRVKAVYDESRLNHLAVVTGQPGIGKTRWIHYALRRCLGEKQPVIWFLSRQFYLFSDTVEIIDPTLLLHPEYTWCFVDSTDADALPTAIYDPFCKLFPVYVTSPKAERWRKLHQLRLPELIIMNPWTMAELEKAAALYPDQKSEGISERFDNAGPSARHCLEFTPLQITRFYATRDAGIKWDTTQHMIAALLDEKEQLRIGEISHRLCVVRRSDSGAWPYTVAPISAFVRHRLLSQLWRWEQRDRLDMINRFSGIPGIGGMIGVLFESEYQHRFVKKIDIVAAPMFRTNNPRSRWHAAFGDFSASPILHKAREEVSSAVSPPVPISLSISPSGSRVYNSGPLAIEENIYYVPLSENEVAIDSFIVHAGHLYLFQFASGPQHGVNRGLLATLARFSGLPAAQNQYIIFIIPKNLAQFNCPHSNNGFLRDHVPYVARIDN